MDSVPVQGDRLPGRHKHTIPLGDGVAAPIPAQLTGALQTQKRLEAVRLPGCPAAADLPAFGCEIPALGQPHRTAARRFLPLPQPRRGQRRGGKVCYIQRLVNMQRPRLAVRPQAAVIGHPVGGGRVLLHLGQQDAGADGVQRTGGDEKDIPFFTGT